MNILYIANEIDVPGSNGGSVHVYEVATGLAMRGHRVLLVCRRDDKQPVFGEMDGVSVLRIAKWRVCLPFSALPMICHRKALKAFGPVDIVVERNNVLGGLGKALALWWGTPYLLEVNTAIYDELIAHRKIRNPITKALIFLVRRIHFGIADHIIGTHAGLVPESARSRFSQTIWGGNTSRFAPELRQSPQAAQLRRKLGLEGHFVVLLATSDTRSKGNESLVHVVERVARADNGVRFLLVGLDASSASVRLLEQAGLEGSCVVAGRVPYSEVAEYMALGDIGLALYSRKIHPPFAKYGFYITPIRIMECQALGLPVVAPRIGNMTMIVQDGRTAILVEEDNFDQYAEAILRLRETGLRSSMGLAAARHAREELTWDKHLDQLCQLLNRLAATTGRHSTTTR
ncbi:MAG: glycosyltransferase family 4 protein [bacterium]